MTSSREAIRDLTRQELDKQFKSDLEAVLMQPAGRRLFSYLLMSTGTRESMPTGTYVDHYNSGRRSVGIELMFACDSIDRPTKTTGMELRQLAEREYVDYQLAIVTDLEDKAIRRQNGTIKGRVSNATEKGKV